ncbi:MAG: bifunctional YncE family protein/alkaline phosphatase family protein [Verrucomicrobiia bacterium]
MNHIWKTAIVFCCVFLVAGCQNKDKYSEINRTRLPAGKIAENRYYTPANQILTPSGIQVELPGMRPQALALSPDGKILVTSGKTHDLVVINPQTGAILKKVPLPSEKDLKPPESISTHILSPDKEGQLSFTGLIFSPDGKRIYLANVNGSIKVFEVVRDSNGVVDVQPSFSILLPPFSAGKRKSDIPAGLAISSDGRRLYVALNLSNRLSEMDAATGKILRIWDVGVAPHDVVLKGDKVYVSNRGGRQPEWDDLSSSAGLGINVRVDPVRYIASEGSISVINLNNDRAIKEILTAPHPAGMALSPDGKYLAVASSGGDLIYIVDTATDNVVEKICARQKPSDLFGAQPNAVAFDKSGKRLYVCNGTQNAVAVINFEAGRSQLVGLIPVGWFPGAVICDSIKNRLYVANIKGIGSTQKYKPGEKVKYNSRQYYGTLSIIKIPSGPELKQMTDKALYNIRYPLIKQAFLPARTNVPPRAVPERVGEPCVFKHVVYIIKENRTYDQILGDMKEGNGDPSLCVFGENVTPNHHKLAREFALLDNTYCSGILSADGHQWADSAIANEYLERSFAGFPRSYPDGMEDDDIDALAYSSAGFIWDMAIVWKKSLRIYGEFAITDKFWRDPTQKGKPKFTDVYKEFINGTSNIVISSHPAIESIRPYLCTNTVGWDMDIPDQFRAAQFIKELNEFEKKDEFPNLSIICLPNDHTSGTKPGSPTPAAHVADNDLALGKIVEAISHSRFWKETCIFVIEDDPQNGWDHVSGYRTVAFVISPYTKRRTVVSTQYNQTSVLRTIELILGLPPMNQMDASATPMFDCFTDKPDFTPYKAVPNNIPLDKLNPEIKKISNPFLQRLARQSEKLPLDKVDQCPEEVLNRIIWHSVKGPDAPFPSYAVKAVIDDD